MSASTIQSLWEMVEKALNEIRPHLAVDGGNVELVEISADHIVSVKWLGTCEHCSMSSMTMKAGVEEVIKSKVPQIKKVIAINGVGLTV